MLQSKLFYKTTKSAFAKGYGPLRHSSSEASEAGEKSADIESVSHGLLVRAGFIDQLMAGVYTFLPLGNKVLKNIENIIRKNMENSPVNGQEVLMPVLQPKENWQKTGRWESLDILFKVKGSGDKEYAMGPTHEEVVSPLAKKNIFSYKDLPISLFQIQTKFRDELRAKSGILRTREFLMKDLYSFHATQEDLDEYYEKMIKVYFNIFRECGIGKATYRALASGGSFSKYSDEFQAITDAGEDIIYICKKCNIAINKEIKGENEKCPNCEKEFAASPKRAGEPRPDESSGWEEKKAVEVGNIFKLGTRYSQPFNLKFTDKDATDKLVIMGCFGIGLSRLMGAVVEINHDEKGIIWPKSIAPFLVHLIGVENNKKVKTATEKIYNSLSSFAKASDGQAKKIEVLYDDRQDKSVGEKFAEADLIGIPYRIVISEKTLKANSVEVKERDKNKIQLVKINKLSKFLA
ncbi:MAG: aminoacyl--tRNA ligase-related protein [Candidatus Staskawiczbacteria bacterium]|nr:aminoacyl--tRNA ligase-related protein [Candidatus Staskawiczbacteria bacterium]